MTDIDKIKAGLIRVAAANESQRMMDINGDNSKCVPVVGRGNGPSICLYCSNAIDLACRKACPSVPPEQRWRIQWPEID